MSCEFRAAAAGTSTSAKGPIAARISSWCFPHADPPGRATIAALCITMDRRRLRGQLSCLSPLLRAIILSAETREQVPSLIARAVEKSSGRRAGQNRFHMKYPRVPDRRSAATIAPRGNRLTLFQHRYPHFYPQVERPSFGYPGCHSVHNQHGDIFVNNHRWKRATSA